MHLKALTGLRLLAALAVYISHVGLPAGAPAWLQTLQASGYAGVTFFFVLSGFVLTVNYHDRLQTPRQVWSYAVARVARVYPLYLVVLCWAAVGLWVAGDLSKRTLLLHLLGVQAWSSDIGVAYALVGPAWSISIELFLYATLPVLLALVRLVDRRTMLLVASILVTLAGIAAVAYLFTTGDRAALPFTDPGSSHRWLYRSPIGRIGDFLAGILAARLWHRLRHTRGGSRAGAWLCTLAVLAALVVGSTPAFLVTAWSWDALYAPCAVALILGLALAPEHPLARFLALRPVVFLGEVSFAFYLVHSLVLELVGGGAWDTAPLHQRLVVEVLNFGLALAVATGLHVGVERPSRVLVKRLLDPSPRPARRPAVAPGPPTAPLDAVPAVRPPAHLPAPAGAVSARPAPARHAVPL